MAVSRNSRFLLTAFVFLLFVSFNFLPGSVLAVENVSISDTRDTAYLRYSVAVVQTGVSATNDLIRDPRRVIRKAENATDTAILLTADNASLSGDAMTRLAIQSWPKLAVLNESPFRFEATVSNSCKGSLLFTITDVGISRDSLSSYPIVWAAGYRCDSAWIRSFSVRSATLGSMSLVPLDSFFVGTGVDQSGDGRWNCEMSCVGAFDYDFDGHSELFIYLTAGIDEKPRSLICLDLVSSKIEWQTPIASQVGYGRIINCMDRERPSVLVATAGPGQKVTDSLFIDTFGYLVRIDSHGQVISHRILSRYPHCISITEMLGESSAFVGHTLPFLSPSPSVDTFPEFMISKISRAGAVQKSVKVSDAVICLWTADYDSDGRDELYALTSARRILVYDTSLSLLAQTNSTANWYFGQMANWGEERNVMFLSTQGDETQVLSPQLERLAILPAVCDYSEPLRVDSLGKVLVTLGGNSQQTLYVTMHRRGLLQMLSIFYARNQIYVLAIMSSLLAGLVVTQLYRRKVSVQKKALENAHLELNAAHTKLQETHQELRSAQAKIVEQEKYRQAKDIAGGFAHEIKNALFPADGALIKQERLLKEPTPDLERVKTTHQTIRSAMTRAISLTRLITTYTKLDSEVRKESINLNAVLDEVLRANVVPIEEREITLLKSGPSEVLTSVNADHLRSIFSNLLLNSVDALHGRPDPIIRIEWSLQDGLIVLYWIDNGCGIAEADLLRIFDAFFSTKPTTGTGLGLAITKKIVELYEGTIAVESRQGEGTRFHIELPIFRG